MSEINQEDIKVKFICPNCGDVARDDVIFLCNTCGTDQLIHKHDIYLCPNCLAPGENFQCMLCESTEVKMRMS